MSYKKAADLQAYMERTGSHSTKPKKVGDNSHLATRSYDVGYTAPKAVDRAANVIEIDRQIEERKERHIGLVVQVKELNEMLSDTLPFERYKELIAMRKDLGRQLDLVQRELGELRRMRHRVLPLRAGSYEQVFVDVARDVLPKDVWLEISDAAHAIMRGMEAKPGE